MAFTNSRFFRAITLLITIFSLSLPAYAQYSGGTGEPNDPYQIATAEDLMLLGDSPEDYDKHFILTADIDLDPNLPGRKVFDRGVIAPDTNDVRWEFDGLSFTGAFDGNGHTISHLTIEGASYIGLFGELASGATVSNLSLEAVDVNGIGNRVGGLAGSSYGAITNCYSTGSVSGSWGVGGLVGENHGVISNCSAIGNVVAGVWAAGGLVGCSGTFSGALIENCHATGSVEGHDYVGGLEGYNHCSTICNCSASGNVISNGSAGGLVGGNTAGEIKNCYSSVNVAGGEEVGGLVGINEMYWGFGGTITTCYSVGTVTGTVRVGGLVGSNEGDVRNSIWDVETSGQSQSEGGVGLTTAEMMDPEMLGLNGWADDPNWVLDSGRDYPRLIWEGTAGQSIPESVIDWMDGMGNSDNPYEIINADQLVMISKASILWDRHFVLRANINLISKTWYTNVIRKFWGTFNGNGCTISNLTIVGGNKLGMFSQLREGAQVLNLGIVDANVVGSGICIGILSGDNDGGNVTNCYSAGSVRGDRVLGGLVGNNIRGDIIDSYSTSVVDGNSYIGGLVGLNTHGNVSNCYSTGMVTGGRWVGGLLGGNNGNVSNCYSTGMVSGNIDVGGLVGGNGGDVTNSFWDVQTSGLTTSNDETGKKTAEMQTADTFLEAGWDFINETENGTDDIWWIDEGQDYPRLWWELIPEN